MFYVIAPSVVIFPRQNSLTLMSML